MDARHRLQRLLYELIENHAMHRSDLVQELIRGTELVVALASGVIGVAQFVTEYDCFYHYNALHGDDGDADDAVLLREFSAACRLHEAVHNEVVAKLYMGRDDVDQYVAAGRLLPQDALPILRRLVQSYDAHAVLRSLRADA